MEDEVGGKGSEPTNVFVITILFDKFRRRIEESDSFFWPSNNVTVAWDPMFYLTLFS